MTSSDRDQRLAAKLRENLRRRKAQAKARLGGDKSAGEDGSASDDVPNDRDADDTKA